MANRLARRSHRFPAADTLPREAPIQVRIEVPNSAMRQLVAVWYLNSLDQQGGETEFQQQDVSITPEAGKLLLFPPFWTHLYRGKTLQSGHKYIATTWVIFT